jgi:FAD/FMN-containing dehydrogenase
MTAMNIVPQSGLAAARDLRANMRGKVVVSGDESYTRVRAIWNGAVDYHPALFALCETNQDVQAAVRAARAHDLPLSVRGGGHDWAGRALRHEGLVIDLSAMRRVEVDVEARVATVAGGATAKDVIAAAAPYGLAAATGSVGAVGMAGLTLGGGYGPLSGQYGLALDNLLGVEIVLADGELVTADGLENPELFWALRGGGGNFGVVTAMRIRLHPVRTVLAGLILFPWFEAEAVFRGYAVSAASASDQLTLQAGVLSGPDGNPTAFLAPTWSGDLAQGEKIISSLLQLGAAMVAELRPMTCADMLGMFDGHVVDGRHYAIQTRWLPKLTRNSIAALVAGGTSRTSPFSGIVLHHFHGAAARVPAAATAFGLRREHFLVELIAAWEPGATDNGDAHRQWAERLSAALAPAALPGGYPNMLGPGDRDQIALAYGSNLNRLQFVKRRFDPDSLFSSAIPLPTGRRRRIAGHGFAAGLS